jgi:hypothetical protein
MSKIVILNKMGTQMNEILMQEDDAMRYTKNTPFWPLF